MSKPTDELIELAAECPVNTAVQRIDRNNIPVRQYGINLAVSGQGMGHSHDATNIVGPDALCIDGLSGHLVDFKTAPEVLVCGGRGSGKMNQHAEYIRQLRQMAKVPVFMEAPGMSPTMRWVRPQGFINGDYPPTKGSQIKLHEAAHKRTLKNLKRAMNWTGKKS